MQHVNQFVQYVCKTYFFKQIFVSQYLMYFDNTAFLFIEILKNSVLNLACGRKPCTAFSLLKKIYLLSLSYFLYYLFHPLHSKYLYPLNFTSMSLTWSLSPTCMYVCRVLPHVPMCVHANKKLVLGHHMCLHMCLTLSYRSQWCVYLPHDSLKIYYS